MTRNQVFALGAVAAAGGYLVLAYVNRWWPLKPVAPPPRPEELPMPGNLRVESCTVTGTNKTKCIVIWDKVEGATGYRLEKLKQDGTWEPWYSGPDARFEKPELYCGQTATSGPFTVRVRAEGADGRVSAWNRQTLYTTPCPAMGQPPGAVTGVRVASCVKG